MLQLLMNETLLTMPKKVKVSGTCTPELAVLTLSWEEDNFSLSFDLRPDVSTFILYCRSYGTAGLIRLYVISTKELLFLLKL